MYISVEYMKIIDRVLMDYLKQNAINGEVHIIYQRVADDLNCGRSTVYRSLIRLRAAGYMRQMDGNNRIGYTYKIN